MDFGLFLSFIRAIVLLWLNPLGRFRSSKTEDRTNGEAIDSNRQNPSAQSKYVKVNVMLPLTTVGNDGFIQNNSHLSWQLDRLRDTGADGFMVDVWWGLTERTSRNYDFRPYEELVLMAEQRNLQVQFVASFHQCGGNIDDECFIPIPEFVRQNNDVWYTDRNGNQNKEYISLFADNVRLSDGRTPLEMYGDWLAALNEVFAPKIPKTLVEVMVGMGPAGELRYPGYYPAGGWKYPGIGEFQVYDTNARASLRASAPAGSGWENPPTDAGWYNSKPWETGFFGKGGYSSDYGKFFLGWYSDKLKEHGSNVLSKARDVLPRDLILAAKIAGIHWSYLDSSHAAECTTGYYNTDGHNAYGEFADLFKSLNASFDFTCFEMTNAEQQGAENLVGQVRDATFKRGVDLAGENALPRYDYGGYQQVLKSKWALKAFTWLRMTDKLMTNGFDAFRWFVQQMHA